MKHIVIALVLLMTSFMSFAQTKIKGAIEEYHVAPMPIKLYQFNNGSLQLVDSAMVSKSGKFTLSNKEASNGTFYIEFNKLFLDLILSSKESEIELTGTYDQLMKGQFVLIGSDENKAYQEYKKIDEAYNRAVVDINKNVRISIIDSFSKRDKEAFMDFLRVRVIKRNDQLFQLANNHKGSFVSEVVIPLAAVPVMDEFPTIARQFDTDVAFLHYHFWDFVNFKNSELVYSPLFKQKIEEYLQKYTDNANGLETLSIDQILSRTKVNDKVYDHAIKCLVEIFGKGQKTKLITYIINNYIAPYNFEFSATTKAVLDVYDGAIPGTKICDAEGFGQYGNFSKISDFYTKSPYTIIYFWSSGVEKLAEVNKNLGAVYTTYKDAGLNVVGFSLDDNEEKWKASMQANPTPWPQISDLKGGQSDVIKNFRIPGVPYVLLVNNKGIIIAVNPSLEIIKSVFNQVK